MLGRKKDAIRPVGSLKKASVSKKHAGSGSAHAKKHRGGSCYADVSDQET